MKKLIIICCVCLSAFTSMMPAENSGDKNFTSLLPSLSDERMEVTRYIDSLYYTIHLDSFGLQKNIFFYACKGYQYLLSQHKLQKTDLLTICDYTQSSTRKRLYVIDMQQGKILYNTYVSHGKNSGSEYATSFSNKSDSHKSSLGFMITGNTYIGKAGYSMCFDGLEKGINNNVQSRSIVMHGSNYVNEQRADDGTAMGRSYGCPAIPYALHKKVINTIKGGSCFFAYADDRLYVSASKILSARFDWPSAIPQLPVTLKIDDAMADQDLQSATTSLQ